MRVLHLASYDEWTGAAAVALEETLALRDAGLEAHIAYMGGGDLGVRLAGVEYAHPILSKKQDPLSVYGCVRGIRMLVGRLGFDVLHSHLTHDHWLALLARSRNRQTTLCRTFHAARALRDDLLTRTMLARTQGVAVSNREAIAHPLLRGRPVEVLPPAVDLDRFRPSGGKARSVHGISGEVVLVGAIGKLETDRGFDQVLRVFRILREEYPAIALMIIGDGDGRAEIREEARALGLEESIVWTGFRGDDLPEHFRALDFLLYVKPGSEEGHRAVIESLACGAPVVTGDLPGIEDVLGDLTHTLLAADPSPKAFAEKARELAALPDRKALGQRCVEAARRYSRPAAAGRLLEFYAHARMAGTGGV